MNVIVVVTAVLAGAAGALARYGVTRAFADHPSRLPLAVFLVNVGGSLVAGVGVALGFELTWLPLIVVSGFAGGLTTFSTFSTETVQLVLEGRARVAILSVVANLVAGIAAFALAFYVVLGVIAASDGNLLG